MLPEGWKYRTVNDLVVFANGKPHEKELCNDGQYILVNSKYISSNGEIYKKTNSSSCIAKKNDILMVMSDVPNGRAIAKCFLVADNQKYAVNQRIAKLTPRNTNPIFLYYSINRNPYYLSFDDGLKQTNLRKDEVLDCPVLTPPLPEQKKIAAILSTWDRAIEGTEKLLANSQQQKKALMQQLLTGKKRLPGFTGEWKIKRINEISDRIKRTSDGKKHPILMISSSIGFVTQDTKYSRYMAGESVKKYILLKEGEFAYNKGNSKLYQFGCVFELREYKQGLVPNVYVCFKIKQEQCSEFYRHLFKFDFLKPQLRAIVNSGIRNNGLLNIKPDQFMNTKVPVPPLPEQKVIAAVLSTADEEITAIESDLSRLRQEKKALMQQLLTGKRRVKVD